MNQIVSIAVESIAREKIKHGGNAVAGVFGVSASPDYLSIAIGVVSLCTACALFYKTWLEIKIRRIDLARKDRRDGLL